MHTRRGTTLTDCLVAIVTLAIVVVTLVPAGDISPASARGRSRDIQCKMQLQALGQMWSAYSITSNDEMPTFNWQRGVQYDTPWSDVRGPHSTQNQAATAQETHLLRNLSGRGWGLGGILWNQSTLPFRTMLPLHAIGFFQANIPAAFVACPEDAPLLVSQADPLNQSLWARMPAGSPNAGQFNTGGVAQRYPYSSSYTPSIAILDADDGLKLRPVPNTTHLLFASQDDRPLRRYSEVVFPANKILMHEASDRHRHGSPLFHAYDDAQPNQLFADGSIRNHRTALSQPGWNGSNPNGGEPYSTYTPLTTDPPSLIPNQPLPVRYRFTRNGLAGFDYGNTQP